MDTHDSPNLLRPITPSDFDAVLAWNEQNVELLAPMDRDRLIELLGLVDLGAVIELDGVPAGFVFTFPAGSSYDSTNYQWFAQRSPTFLYLDRIVIDSAVRRSGLASRVYDEIEQRARELGPVLCLEVNLDPPNEPSLAFHRRRGFVEVGQREAGGHVVSLLEKRV